MSKGNYGCWELIDNTKGRKVFHGPCLSKENLMRSWTWKDARKEAANLIKAHEVTNGLSPKFYALEAHEHEGYWYASIVMENIQGIVAKEYFSNAIDWSDYRRHVVNTLKKCKIDHRDLNPGNVIITQTGFRVIDWDATYIEFLEE